MKKQTNVFLAIMLTLICALSFTACSNNNEIADWGEWTVLSLPSCTDDGVEVRASKSDSTVLETRTYAAALGHGWEGWTEVTAPTCLVDGVEKRLCKTCGNYDYQAIPALGCDFGDWIVTVTPTCFTGGSETRVCNRDSNHIQTRSIVRLNHFWGEWILTTAATEGTDAIETRICKNDKDHIETRTLTNTATGTKEILFARYIDGGNDVYRISLSASAKEKSGTIYILAYYNGLPLVEIADGGFMNCKNIDSVVFLGDSLIRKIGQNAFVMCTNLVSIEIPESVEYIGAGAFMYCNNLTTIEISANVTSVGENAFKNWSATQTIYVKGFATQIEADTAWGANWRKDCNATIIYQG